jgi:transcriptional regulator with XRE-family HTH domain
MATPATATSPRRTDVAAFGQLLAERRRQLGLSQRDLADQLCAAAGSPTFTRHEISRYERGTRLPRPWVLAAIAVCLDVPAAALTALANAAVARP